MTTMANYRFNNSYWPRMNYPASSYYNEYLYGFDEHVTSYNSSSMRVNQRDEDDSQSSFEADEQSSQAISTEDSPPTESFPLDMSCRVCGAAAHGYNFDQITCESCKAFFRRNALRDTSQIKCRFTDSCPISANTRRQCTACRLRKCFAVNMRKEWIRTDEEREFRKLRDFQKQQRRLHRFSPYEQPIIHFPIVMRKKKRLMPPPPPPLQHHSVSDQRIAPISRPTTFGIHSHLSDHDQILLNNIRNAYQYGADRANFNHLNRYTSNSSLSQFLNDESVNHQSLIYFYKQIPEFRQFDVEDQILLIKCNMVNLIHLHHVVLQNFHEPQQMADHMSKWIGPDFHIQMSRTRSRFDCFMKYPLILQISLIVFVFSINLSTPRGTARFRDYANRRRLYECQNMYLDILWRYLNYSFDERDAIRGMGIIVMQILRYQTLMNTMDEALRRNNAHQDIFNPLMQSIFSLT